MSSISGKLDPIYLNILEHPLQDWHQVLKTWWLPASLGVVAFGAALTLLAEGRLLSLLLVLMAVSCLGLILTMAAYLQHLKREKARIQELLAQAQAREQELSVLRKQDRDKADLLCVLAHDLRTPFSSLKNMIWLMEQGQLSPHEIDGLLPRLGRQIDGLYSSLDNLLLWSKNQAGGRSTQILPVPVAAVAREMCEMYRPAAQQKLVELIAPAFTPTMALADIDGLRLILRNLLDNAIKFTPSGGSITLGVEARGPEVSLYVEDTGIGMNTGQLNQLFACGGTSVRRGTAGEKGFGIGMQLCRSYAEQAGGSFKVTSHPGRGTRFELLLPALEAPVPSKSRL